jgi:predicted P-loop ATPase
LPHHSSASRFTAGAAEQRDEREHIQPQQEARYEADVWEDKIRDFLMDQIRVTVGQVAIDGLGFETPRIGRSDQNRIMAAMERLGWKRERPDANTDWQGKRWWVRVNPESEQQRWRSRPTSSLWSRSNIFRGLYLPQRTAAHFSI